MILKYITSLNHKTIIIADVDETICETCQPISAEMVHVINELIKNGYQLVFISGTDYKNLQPMLSGIIGDHDILANTGTTYVKIKNQQQKMIYNLSLTKKQKEEIMTAFEKLITHFNIVPVTNKQDQLQDRDTQITLSAIGRNAPLEAKKKFDPGGSIRRRWVEFLKQYLQEEKYDLKIGGTTSIDITKKGLDKAWGITTFLNHHNIPQEKVIFFGDKLYPRGNDYPATKIVDCISVKNPEDTLQKLQHLFL